jgi:PAS domain S-box-containing protein
MSRPLRVLFIEDSEDDTLFLLNHLGRQGYEVKYERVETSEAMEAAIDQQDWDLILCDHSMSHFNSSSALNLVKKRGLDLPFILVAGRIGEENAVAALKAGAQNYIFKQNLDPLVPIIERELTEAEARRDRKLMQENLIRTKERLEEIISLSAAVIYTCRPSEKFAATFVTENITAHLGYEPQECIKDPKWWVNHIHPEDAPRIYAELPRLFEKGHYVHEYRFLHKNGTYHWLHDDSRLVRDSAGNPHEIIGSLLDITNRKQDERRLAQTVEQLKNSNTELEHFAYVASHDLQEPLRIVSSFAQLLARRYQGKLEAEGQEFIAYIVDGANRMQELIKDLLTYSRVATRGNSFAPVNSEIALKEAIANIQTAVEECNAVITYDPLPTVVADTIQLVQVFQNLISNALKFRQDEPPRVHVHSEENGGEWLFAIRDNGIGMDMQYADRVFAIFQRLHSHQKYPGTGIGLAICKKAVERTKGRIWFESQLGKGTTFYFTLPKEMRAHEIFNETIQPLPADGGVLRGG